MLQTSQNGGANGNGAIIEHDLSSNNTTVKASLEGNFIGGYNLVTDLNISEEITFGAGGLIEGQDGSYMEFPR